MIDTPEELERLAADLKIQLVKPETLQKLFPDRRAAHGACWPQLDLLSCPGGPHWSPGDGIVVPEHIV
ncbi:MAG: hypothetical protein P8N43_02095 [Alphaproteobacteria bacterium]|nr:hypothetical protein [Alphaproteobacteria bacterium]